jgi:wyosine [tRNA(Phe)-imidazoG37] synthetase (radical SAM superfamily)
LKGVPGIVPERFNEAQKIQHCALSLVGEPILYPYINEFVDMLHEVCIMAEAFAILHYLTNLAPYFVVPRDQRAVS